MAKPYHNKILFENRNGGKYYHFPLEIYEGWVQPFPQRKFRVTLEDQVLLEHFQFCKSTLDHFWDLPACNKLWITIRPYLHGMTDCISVSGCTLTRPDIHGLPEDRMDCVTIHDPMKDYPFDMILMGHNSIPTGLKKMSAVLRCDWLTMTIETEEIVRV